MGPQRLRKAFAALSDVLRDDRDRLERLLDRIVMRTTPRLSAAELRNIVIGIRWGLNFDFDNESPAKRAELRAADDNWCAAYLDDLAMRLGPARRQNPATNALIATVAGGFLIGDRRPSREPDDDKLIVPLHTPQLSLHVKQRKADAEAPSPIKDVMLRIGAAMRQPLPAQSNAS
ncbi:MAG TPA: hypothetical protein VLJ86_13925 [Ramlibacter sp.]|nr:hypothetical protein [Ramlibacter sp.]